MADPPLADAEPVEESRKKRIIKILAHILFHIFLISFFIWATIVYTRYDRDGSDCTEPEEETTLAPAPAEQNPADQPAEEQPAAVPASTTTTEKPKPEWKPHILCEFNWCIGYGFFLLLFIIFYLFWLYYWAFKPYIGQKLYDNQIEPIINKWIDFSRQIVVSIIMLAIVIILVGVYLAFECRDNFLKLVGLSGPVVFIFLGFLITQDRKAIPWRIVVHGLLGQLLLGILCIRLAVGRDVFKCAGDRVSNFLRFTEHGSRFVYGDRINDEFVFAFAILAVIFFFSVVTSILYYVGFMQFVLIAFGFLLQSMVGTTVCESVNAVGNVFLGMLESPLMIRPYIRLLTLSELHCICVSGFATVAGTVLGAYISFGASPAYLITASVMAAPGSLAFAKLFYPETEESQTKASNIQLEKSTDSSILDAAASGAANGMAIVLSIVSTIIAFLAIVYFLNAVTEWMFELAGKDGVTFIFLATKLFIPIVFVMGVPTYDCEKIALVIAEKTIINEFVGYKTLGQMIRDEQVDQRSSGIATFALCGFANPGSLGVLIAALSAMAPERRHDIPRVAVRALLAGSLVSFTSAAIAGILIQESDLDNLSKSLLAVVDANEENAGKYLYHI